MIKGQPQKMAPRWIVEVFVRRGALRRFSEFTRKTTELPVRVTWDRRLHETRLPDAQPERRQEPPFTWKVADFVAVERPVSEGDQE